MYCYNLVLGNKYEIGLLKLKMINLGSEKILRGLSDIWERELLYNKINIKPLDIQTHELSRGAFIALTGLTRRERLIR